MAEETKPPSPNNDMPPTSAPEDADTRAARRELKQHSISDPVAEGPNDDDGRPETPADDDVTDERNNELKEQLSSPKKKRGHDQLDPIKDEEPKDNDSVVSADSAKDRASRSEPEKKRHRDTDGDADGADEVNFSSYNNNLSRRLMNLVQTKPDQDETKTEPKSDLKTEPKSDPETATQEDNPEVTKKEPPQTSASAFAASGFGKLAAGTSPFAGLGGTTGSAFGSPGKAPLGSFASSKKTEAQSLASAPKLSFGGATDASPFASAPPRTNGFGGGLGGSGFGSASGVKPLSSFSSGASKPFQNQKSAKPFGAPDSDVEEDGDEDNVDEEEGNSGADKDRDVLSEKDDDKSKVKLHKGLFTMLLSSVSRANVMDQSTSMMAKPAKLPFCLSEQRCLFTRMTLGRSAELEC